MLRPVFLLWLATGMATVAGVVRMKLFALVLSPAQLGVFGNFVNLHNLLLFVGTLGMASAITQRLAQTAGSGDTPHTTTIASTALWAQLAATMFICSGLFAFPGIIRAQVPALYVATPLVTWCAALSVLASVGVVWVTSVVQGVQRLEVSAIAATVGSVVSLGLTIPIVLRWGFIGAFVSFPISNLLTLVLFLVVVWRARELGHLRIVPTFSGPDFSRLLMFGLGAFAGTAAVQFSLQALRQALLQHAGAEAAGFLHVALQTGLYINSFALAIGTYLLSVTGALTDAAEMGRQFNRAFSLGCVLLVLAGTILVLFGDFCIQAAFSAKFLPVVGMLGILAAAELFRACSYYASSLLLGRGRWQEYLAGSLLFCVPILAVAWSLFPILADIRAALIAYASGGCITLVLLLLLLRRREGICLTRGNQVALAAGLACLALAHLLRQSPWWARTTCAAVVVTGGGLRVLGMWRYPFANAIAATVRSRTQRP